MTGTANFSETLPFHSRNFYIFIRLFCSRPIRIKFKWPGEKRKAIGSFLRRQLTSLTGPLNAVVTSIPSQTRGQDTFPPRPREPPTTRERAEECEADILQRRTRQKWKRGLGFVTEVSAICTTNATSILLTRA